MAGEEKKNLRPVTPELVWDPDQPLQSLAAVGKAVEREAQNSIDWYWRQKTWKRIPARAIQFLSLFLTASAGLGPVLVQIYKGSHPGLLTAFDSGPYAALFVGIAAALLGMDKAFGYSSGWTRYVLTATSMTKLLREFRVDWLALSAAAAASPAAEAPRQYAAMFQRAKDFVSAMQGMVLEETKDWANEFQSNMAQMEKDLKAQLDVLKAQAEKAALEKEAVARPGAIEATVTNADQADGHHFDVTLEGVVGKSTEPVLHAKVWTRIHVPPGVYKLSVNAQVKGKPVSTSQVVEIKPGEIARPSLSLPV